MEEAAAGGALVVGWPAGLYFIQDMLCAACACQRSWQQLLARQVIFSISGMWAALTLVAPYRPMAMNSVLMPWGPLRDAVPGGCRVLCRCGAKGFDLGAQPCQFLFLARCGGLFSAAAHHEPHHQPHADWAGQHGNDEKQLFHGGP
ncbi:hypothetical protein [Pseudarthrobacter sp. NS4]|uniref:hypothetical protein n=1 Tax=Pseudarthrobacter sp. NS4 TaxID=2973976 RepID=UPI002162BB57|nr:hypothetical protein [Pseudarthrobacter sp. NS4]